MKLGIFLLIFGLLIAGAGAYAWQYYSPTFLGYRGHEAQQFFSLGMAGMILGWFGYWWNYQNDSKDMKRTMANCTTVHGIIQVQ